MCPQGAVLVVAWQWVRMLVIPVDLMSDLATVSCLVQYWMMVMVLALKQQHSTC